MMEIDRPDARVIGAQLAYALGVGEAASVVIDFSEQPGTSRVGQSGNVGDDRIVGMLLKQLR